MSRKTIITGVVLLVVAVVVLVALGVWLGSVLRGGGTAGPSPYSAVLLSNGDMYFGKLSWFPAPRLTNVWVLQRTVDQNNQQQLGVGQFNKAFWGPMDELNLNSKEIVWWSRIRSDSQLAKAIENPSSVQQQPATGNQQQQQATSTFRGPSGQPPR